MAYYYKINKDQDFVTVFDSETKKEITVFKKLFQENSKWFVSHYGTGEATSEETKSYIKLIKEGCELADSLNSEHEMVREGAIRFLVRNTEELKENNIQL